MGVGIRVERGSTKEEFALSPCAFVCDVVGASVAVERVVHLRFCFSKKVAYCVQITRHSCNAEVS